MGPIEAFGPGGNSSTLLLPHLLDAQVDFSCFSYTLILLFFSLSDGSFYLCLDVCEDDDQNKDNADNAGGNSSTLLMPHLLDAQVGFSSFSYTLIPLLMLDEDGWDVKDAQVGSFSFPLTPSDSV